MDEDRMTRVTLDRGSPERRDWPTRPLGVLALIGFTAVTPLDQAVPGRTAKVVAGKVVFQAP